MLKNLTLAFMATAFSTSVWANDSMAELKTGGLVLTRSDAISMEKESLFISRRDVKVDYVFRNNADKDIETIVAFPMPDIRSEPGANLAIYNFESDNFLDFSVSQDGEDIKPNLEQRAELTGRDVTSELQAHKIPLLSFSSKTAAALAQLPADTKADWLKRGLIYDMEYDVGQGMEHHLVPLWTLRSTYWWKARFPAKAKTVVKHRYTPSVGGVSSLGPDAFDGKSQRYKMYNRFFCMDAGFLRSAMKAAQETQSGRAMYGELRISYVLTTGANWDGPIKDFTLTVDKGKPEDMVSFCGENVKKIGPTTFEMKAKDFWPEDDLNILIINKVTE